MDEQLRKYIEAHQIQANWVEFERLARKLTCSCDECKKQHKQDLPSVLRRIAWDMEEAAIAGV